MAISTEMVEIVGPVLVAGLLVALIHAPLGVEVLKRGIIFIDLAVAQIAGLGLVAAGTLLQKPSLWLIQGVALGSAIAAGLFFHWVEKALPRQQEAIIGCSFVLAASLSLLLLADHPHGGDKIQHLLSGQILFVTWQDVAKHTPIYALILAVWFIKPAIRSSIGFYILFALAITSSVQLVGVYVVFASLILPALAATHSANKYSTAWLCGTISALTGIVSATLLDLPAGPIIVVTFVFIAMIIFIISWRKSSSV